MSDSAATRRGIKSGSVPTAAVGPVIAQLVEERWPARRRPEGEEWGYSILAEKVGCSWDTIGTIVRQSNEGVGFDLVDKLLCALGRPDLWTGALEHIYPWKFTETCAIPSCSRSFPEYHRGTRRIYCSRRCMELGQGMKKGYCTGQRFRKRGYCLKGHKLTPENRVGPNNGCRTCKKESDRLRHLRNRDKRLAQMAANRERKRAARAA